MENWIDVNEKTPADKKRVLACAKDFITKAVFVTILRHLSDGWYSGRIMTGEILYWKPLPEMPAELSKNCGPEKNALSDFLDGSCDNITEIA